MRLATELILYISETFSLWGDRKFKESAHLSTEGSLDMYAIMKALVDVGFTGVIRPDHGRTIWGSSNARIWSV